eukprot:6211799-Pleurochrysis_carterae.AAC.1
MRSRLISSAKPAALGVIFSPVRRHLRNLHITQVTFRRATTSEYEYGRSDQPAEHKNWLGQSLEAMSWSTGTAAATASRSQKRLAWVTMNFLDIKYHTKLTSAMIAKRRSAVCR